MGVTIDRRNAMFLLIENWQQSGLSQKDFCEQQQVSGPVFYYWYKRYRTNHDTVALKEAKGFVELRPDVTNSTGAAIELLLAGGHRLLFHQPVSASFIKAIIS